MPVWKIEPADLIWDENGLPRSRQFNDLYFSAENGLAETRHVFLKGNQLQERWKRLKSDENFVICETGFGSGLNLLAVADLWQKTAPEAARLHFISTELFPMAKKDLERTLSHWPELRSLADELLSKYPYLTPGFHRFELGSNISITLIFDEVIDALTELCPTLATELWDYHNWNVDAWFLDGFAPSQNPEMWAEKLFPLMHRLSANNATVATFTCAGVVKRGLKDWGFDIKKVPGYGRKREMLIAKRKPEMLADLSSLKEPHRNASPCWHLDDHQTDKPGSVAIIGAGIAGCTLAEALSRRNIPTTIFDKEGTAAGASGNPQAALYVRLSPDNGDLEDFCLEALNYALNFYTNRINDPELGTFCSQIQLPRNEREADKMPRIDERFEYAQDFCRQISDHQTNEFSGLNLGTKALYMPHSTWINGPTFCESLLQQAESTIITGQDITDIREKQDKYELFSGHESLGTFDTVVLCTAMGTRAFDKASWLPVRPIRGQISFLQNQPETQRLKAILCRETSITPAYQGMQSVGATYDLDTDSSEIKAEDHKKNLEKLQGLLGLSEKLDIDIHHLKGRASTRTTTPDYLPIVGSLPDLDRFLDQYQLWSKDRKRAIPEAHSGHRGLYLNLGYGSRGYTYAPLCAELLASKIAREPEPISNKMQRSLHPSRFLVRSLSRNRPIGN